MPLLGFWGGSLGLGETLLILAAVLLLFGAKRLPSIARSLGKALEEFKQASRGVAREFHEGSASAHASHTPPPAKVEGGEDVPYPELQSHVKEDETPDHERPGGC